MQLRKNKQILANRYDNKSEFVMPFPTELIVERV